jgi:hypothetical protein
MRENWSDKEFVLKKIKNEGGMTLEFVSLELRNDREVVMKAVKQYGWALQFASEQLRKDKEFMKMVEEEIN